ncbi:GON-4-like protein [Hippoglossus hippoglossus]|uniref:GON-4-like protein n=1 Tax=Hippoglossus hippoglossus TaxID=8267 RepID=UPI00148E8EBC|nr:GON-4-like protein [Hippoglossus hippoglossus]
MNPVRKRLRLGPSPSPPATTSSNRSLTPPGPQLLSHDALLLPPLPAPAWGETEEEDEGYLLVEEDTTDSSLIITMEDSQLEVKAARRRPVRKRRGKRTEEEEEQGARGSESDEKEEMEIDRQLDQSLETKSKQHNLTTVNVRNIIHEVITNEHVVAMMKAAINETEAIPPFEPKMTRSKFKEVVEKGVVIPAWNISPIKKSNEVNKPPQFVDIHLAEEDSSDEEYRPDEEDEDETAEDTFQESDMESTASSPRGSRLSRVEEDSCSPWQTSRSRSRILRVRSVSMGPPPPPKAPPPKAVTDCTFLEKLHAVEEELAVCMEPYQPLSEPEAAAGLMAYRTRSKRTLRDVPLGQLEAELRAPDITPDMYDSSSAHKDRDWTDWLRGLMSSDMENEEECDDDDDPEYNFLADIDEPDQEDYRDDKAVRITKKEVNELMEELFETLKEDLAGQEGDDEGHEEEEEPQEEIHPVQDQHSIGLVDEEDGPITELRTVKQQLAWMRNRRQTHPLCNTHIYGPEPYTLKLDGKQKSRLQQHLQQHVQLLTQIHLLSSPVTKLQSEAETTRQFLVELDVLAQRAELLMSSSRPGFCSVFRSSNLQGALQLMEELRQTPISYKSQHHPPDARGYMRCYPVMPAELAWLFTTRPVFLYPELLPCASLDPALYCPRRTAAFTAAEDCLLVLGLRNMEGSCDPTKLVSQFLLRKTLVQVRRRILQCCRPGVPDNIVKVFRYHRVLWPMPVAFGPVNSAEQRPPVEREESVMPLWLVRSLPVIYPTIKRYNAPSGSTPEAPPTCRGSRLRQSHLTFLRSASNKYSFPSGTRYPPRLPKDLDFKRIGFVMLQQPLPPSPADSSPLPDGQVYPSCPAPLSPHKPCHPRALSPSRVLLTITTAAVAPATTQQIRRHFQTLAGLRRRRREKHTMNGEAVRSNVEALAPPPPPDGPAPSPVGVEEDDDVISVNMEEEEEESEFLLALSESSSSAAGSVANLEDLADPKEVESESEQDVTQTPSTAEEEEGDDGDDDDDGVTSSDESRAGVLQLQEKLLPEETEEEEEQADEDQREDEAFAKDYLNRVCDVVQASPGVSEQLLQLLDQFSAAGPLEASGAPERLYDRLSGLLRPWPQLLRDFAAFLNGEQARRCGLFLEQQLFECSRRFLRRLGQSLGETSSLYQQVVSVLQGSPTPPPEDMDKISSLLRHHQDLQQLFLQFHTHSSPIATSSEAMKTDSVVQSRPHRNRKGVDRQTSEARETGSEEEEVQERPVCARNISTTSTGEKVVVWTREADRAILTACQQRGANRKTFRQVSAQLGNKTAQQVSLRFHDLMNLFQSSSQKSTPCSSEGQPIRRQEPAPD